MRYYLLNILLIMISGTSFAGKVVFLHGTSSAGKTSICRELIRQSDQWKVVSEDDIYFEQWAQRFEDEFPKIFQAIKEVINAENLFPAIMGNYILYRSDAPKEKRLKAKAAIGIIQEEINSRIKGDEWENPKSWINNLRKQITQSIIGLARTHHVLVDTWILQDDHFKQITKECDVIRVVAYCSFTDMIKRTLKRNCNGLINGKDISQFRFLGQGLKGFTKRYDLSDKIDGSIASLEKMSVIHGLDIVSLCLSDSPNTKSAIKTFSFHEFSLEELEEYKTELMSKFTSEMAYVVPKFKVDEVIRTDQKSPIDCAKKIIELVEGTSNNMVY